MTERWAHLLYDFLELVSGRIINEISDISRVALKISGAKKIAALRNISLASLNSRTSLSSSLVS